MTLRQAQREQPEVLGSSYGEKAYDVTQITEQQTVARARSKPVASSAKNSLRSVLLSFIGLASAGCASMSSSRPCEPPPGMPDRPCVAEEARQPYYRQDQPDAIAATGKPQLVVLYLPSGPDGGCPNCALFRPKVHELEVEYWDRIDFVYLNKETEGLEPLLQEFRVPRMPMGG